VVLLANGSHSIHSLAYGETFHPVVGPVAEAEALYVRQLRLVERLRQCAGEFIVWDVGLGAAANSLTVLRALRSGGGRLRLISFDCTVEPLQFALQHSSELGYLDGYEPLLNALVKTPDLCAHFGESGQEVEWELHLGDFPTLLGQAPIQSLPKPHAILFDAYSPASNPEMWTLPLFTRLYGLLDPARPCALPTYSRSTMLRVTLLLAGFFVGRGHATGEKEETTIAANTVDLVDDPLDRRWLKRARNSTSAEPLSSPPYRQAPLSPEALEQLTGHPQFK
jgi:tRNA U34 5-methylaminomethyl-2-thiouridine-forming methyltransferase MnmC